MAGLQAAVPAPYKIDDAHWRQGRERLVYAEWFCAVRLVPAFGRDGADLATAGATSSDISAFTPDRPALVDSAHPVSWLV